jgi:hypothetical protein
MEQKSKARSHIFSKKFPFPWRKNFKPKVTGALRLKFHPPRRAEEFAQRTHVLQKLCLYIKHVSSVSVREGRATCFVVLLLLMLEICALFVIFSALF